MKDGRTKQSSVPATRGTAAAYAPAAPRVPVADCGRSARMRHSNDVNEARPKFPSNKISATFLEFLAPIMEVVNDPDDRQETEGILMLGFTVWNAVVYADAVGDNKHLAALQQVMSDAPQSRPLIDRLIKRKRTHYAHDQRLIGKYELKTVNGEVRLMVEGRSPFADEK